jgi:ribosomal protein S18 acetylase RimI-like enzyme
MAGGRGGLHRLRASPRFVDADTTCYLEDLYVDPVVRGHGIGRALIDDLVRLGRDNGWSRIYWHTRQSNEAARRLYDKFAKADDFVRYRLFLG